MKISVRASAMLAGCTLAVAVVLSGCATTMDSGEAINVDEAGITLSGADTVAYWSLDRDADAVIGSEELTTTWRSAEWRFSATENRDAFAEVPADYAPEFGGYCAMAMADGNLAAPDPDAWTIYEGNLYVFARKAGRDRWREDPDRYIAAARGHWGEKRQELTDDS